MATQRQIRRGTTAECDGMTPVLAELIYDTTLKQFRHGDGTTAGGIKVQNVETATGSGSPVRATSPTITNLTVGGAFAAPNLVDNSDLAQMAAHTIKGNNTSGTANASDLSTSDLRGMILPQTYLLGPFTIDFNSANTDTAVTITLPTGITRYRQNGMVVAGASASISSATLGLFSATGGGGTAFVTNTAMTITTASENSANNAQTLAGAVLATQSVNHSTLYIRVGTAQGSPATAKVFLNIIPYPS